MKCLVALGRSGIKEDPLIDAIKGARHRASIVAGESGDHRRSRKG